MGLHPCFDSVVETGNGTKALFNWKGCNFKGLCSRQKHLDCCFGGMDTSVGTYVHLHFAAHQCRPSESVEIIVSICCGATGNNLHLLNVHVRLEGSVEKYSTLDSGFIDCLDLVCK